MLKIVTLSTVVASAVLAIARAYNNNGATWKLDADGKIEMKDGNPVMVGADGKELPVSTDAFAQLRGEAKTNRERAERLQAEVAKFAGITDPAAALAALETVSKLDQKQLIEAGKVDEVKAQITAQYQTQVNELSGKNKELQKVADDRLLDLSFATSEFIANELAMPVDFFRAAVRDNFKIENGKIVPYDKSGNPLHSSDTSRIGQPAEFDEALRLIVGSHPQKASILRADANSGTGGNSNGGIRGGVRTVSRTDFAKKPPHEQAQIAEKAGKGEMSIVD